MTQSNDRLDRIEAIVESTARSLQAFGDDVATSRLQADEERRELRQAMIRLEGVAEGIANLLARQDEIQPTILAKLNSIERKVDRLLGPEIDD